MKLYGYTNFNGCPRIQLDRKKILQGCGKKIKTNCQKFSKGKKYEIYFGYLKPKWKEKEHRQEEIKVVQLKLLSLIYLVKILEAVDFKGGEMCSLYGVLQSQEVKPKQ